MDQKIISRWKDSDLLVRFLLLVPASIVLFIVASILHNLIYAAGLAFFGDGFWEAFGGDEVVFFFLAVFGAPILFLVGLSGSIYLGMKKLLSGKGAKADRKEMKNN
jgi:hypothetical protein